jgi:DNA-directed RNA polymerase specialized sigma24 family protein
MTSPNAPSPEAVAPLRSTITHIAEGAVDAVVAYLRDPESLRIANTAAAALDGVVTIQTRRQCRCSDRIFPADLDDLKQATLILLFNRGYLIGNHLLRDSVRRADDNAHIAGFIRAAVAAAVRFSTREFLRAPFVQARNRTAIKDPYASQIDDLAEERASHDESLELRKLALELIPNGTDEEKEIVQLRAEGMTYSEVAAVLELPPERIKTVIRCIRKRMRRRRSITQTKTPPSAWRPANGPRGELRSPREP